MPSRQEHAGVDDTHIYGPSHRASPGGRTNSYLQPETSGGVELAFLRSFSSCRTSRVADVDESPLSNRWQENSATIQRMIVL